MALGFQSLEPLQVLAVCLSTSCSYLKQRISFVCIHSPKATLVGHWALFDDVISGYSRMGARVGR